MQHIKRHKKLTAFLAVIAALLVAFAMILPSYGGEAEGLIAAAKANGNVAEGTAGGRVFIGQGKNNYSSWSMSKTKAFEVPKEYAVRLHSYYNAEKYKPTKLDATGNITKRVTCMKDSSGRTLVMDPDDGPIFKLSKFKTGKGVNLTYHNLYIYDPKDDGALKKGKAGYVPVDLTVSATSYTDQQFDLALTEDPLIQFSDDVNGLPSLTVFNIGEVNIRYEYTYGEASSKSGQQYKIKSNMTYDDIDGGQGIGLKNSSANYYVAENSQLAYTNMGSFDYFYGNTAEDISESDKAKEERVAFGQTYTTAVQTITYTSASTYKGTLTDSPRGKWSHFGASAYSMVKLIPPDPNKTVSDSDKVSASVKGGVVNWGTDEDEYTVLNGVGSPKTSWDYNVEQVIPGGISEQWRYDDIQFDDKISQLVNIKKVSVKAGNTDATGWFDINVGDDNHVTAKLRKGLGEATLAKIYRAKDTSITMVIRVALKRSLTMQDFRGANALVPDTRGEEGAIHIENTASTTIVDRSTSGKAENTIKTGKTDTYIKVPSIEDPVKKVSDSDEKKTDHNTIRFFDDEPFEYDAYQKVKSDQIHFDHFYLQDNMDPCIHEESSQGQIRVYDEKENDRTEWFRVTVDENDVGENRGLKYYTVKATAKAETLKNEDFYGHTYDLRWKNDLKSETKYKDQGISKDWWSKCKVSFNDQTGHYDADKTKLVVPNQAFRVIDEGTHDYPDYIQDGQKGVQIEKKYKKDTNKVDTTIHMPKNSIDKSADRYEYQVYNKKDNTSGDDIIHYTVVIKNSNPLPDNKNAANYVVVKDIDFPDGLTIDPDSYKVSGFKETNEKPENTKEYGSLNHTNDEFGSFRAFGGGVNLTKDPDADTTNARYTIKTIKNKTGGGDGFEFKTRYMAYNEPITIEFDAMADKTLNGKHVKNTATLSSDGVEDKSDDEIVYINSPKMDVKKTVSEDVVDEDGNAENPKEGEKKSYHTGDTINYKIVVKNINPGTFARNMVFTDQITTFNGKTPGVNINSNSITVRDLDGNLYNRGSNAAGTTGNKADYLVEDLKDTSGRKTTGFKLTFTKPNMGWYKDTAVPPVKWSNTADWQHKQTSESENTEAKINSHYNYDKDYKGLQLMNGYVITYSATVTDADLAGKTINNVAVSQPGKNTNGKDVKNDPEIPSGKGEDEKNVPLDGHDPKLKITKSSNKRIYKLGEVGHYTLTVTNPVEKSTATGCIIKDQFDLTGMTIDKYSIKVAKNGEDITKDCGIDMVQTGFDRDNGSNGKVYNGFFITPPDRAGHNAENRNEPLSSLTNGDKYTVTYDVHFDRKTLVDKNLRNVARASSDNCTEDNSKEPEPVKVGDGMTAVKSSDPMPGTVVKNGKVIKYTITVNNPTKEDKTNVMIRDLIPEHSTFYASNDKDLEQIEPNLIAGKDQVHSAADDNTGITTTTGGKTSDYKDAETQDSFLNPMTISGKKYFIAVIKNIPAGKSASVSFKVRVDDDAKAEDIIHNVAEVHKALSTEVNGKDNYTPHRVPQELFATAHFDPTNATDHPLRYWVQADNTVTIPGDGTPTPTPGKPDTETPDKKLTKSVKETRYQEGDQLHYTVRLRATDDDLTNPQIKDEIKDGKATIDPNSMKIALVSGNVTTEITKDCDVNVANDGHSYTVKTQKDGSSNTFTLKQGESLEVTYTAKAGKVDGDIENTAQGKADNSPEWISDKTTVPPNSENPGKDIKKSVKEDTYREGKLLHYTVDVGSKSSDLTNPQIKDEIKGGKATIDPNSLVVDLVHGGTILEITKDCDVNVASDGHSYTVKTQKDGTSRNYTLKKGDVIRVSYTAKAGKVNGNIENVAQTRADNSPRWESDKTTVPPDTENPGKTIKKNVEEKLYNEGDTLHYTVDVSSAAADLENPRIKDEIKDGKATIDPNSIVVDLVSGNMITDITKDCDVNVASDGHSYTVKTQKDGTSRNYTLKKGEVIRVSYTAKAGKVDGNIENVAQTSADNSPEWLSDTTSVPPTNGESKTIEKNVKEERYSEGEILHYTVNVNSKTSDLLNPQIKDEIKDGKATIDSNSLMVTLVRGGAVTDITKECYVKVADDGHSYIVKTQKDGSSNTFTLKRGESLEVTYTAKAGKINGNIENIAQTKADNSPDWISDTTSVPPSNTPDKKIDKSIEEKSYMLNDTLHYRVLVSNDASDLINPQVVDRITKGSAKIDSGSLKVELIHGNVATDITKDVGIKTDSDLAGYTVTTQQAGSNSSFVLAKGDRLQITYTAKADKLDGNIDNTAKTKADNSPDWISDTTSVPPSNTPDKKIDKSIEEKSYTEGSTLHYRVLVSNNASDLINPQVVDRITRGSAKINSGSLKVHLIHGNVATDITKNVGIKTDSDLAGYTVTTQQTGSDNKFVLAKGDALQITYTAKAGKVSGNIENTAKTKAENSPEWVSDTASVTPGKEKAKLEITKDVKESTYKKGDTLHYTVKLTAKNGTVKNVVLEDLFDTSSVAYNKGSVKVLLAGKDITSDCKISFSGNGMTIKTGKDLEEGKTITVTYSAKVTGNPSSITNVATGEGDNVKPVKDTRTVTPGGNGGTNSTSSGSGSTGGESGSHGSVAKTGDTSNYMWFGIAAAAAAAIVITLVVRRKKRQ